jgi:hypothetical protein
MPACEGARREGLIGVSCFEASESVAKRGLSLRVTGFRDCEDSVVETFKWLKKCCQLNLMPDCEGARREGLIGVSCFEASESVAKRA